MRINGSNRPVSGASRAAGRKTEGSGASFSPSDAQSAGRSSGAVPVSASTAIDAILALQAVEDPLFAKRKAVKRGQNMLDVLEEIKADLLAGKVNEGRLNRLMAFVTQAKEQSDPKLDALIADIELRAKVELAKQGIYAGERGA